MRFKLTIQIPKKLRRQMDKWRGIQRVDKITPQIAVKELYKDKEQEKFEKEIKAACPDPKVFVPFMAICTLAGIQRTQMDGDPTVSKFAGRWLRGLWDHCDIAFIQPALSNPHDPQAGVSYLVLEYYFKHQGDWESARDELQGMLKRHGLKNLTPEQVEYFGSKIAEMIRTQIKANESK
jgi:hypothetical protein